MSIETGDSVTFEFTGRLDDGETIFDTSHEAVAEEEGLTEVRPDREFAPLTVEIGSGEVIEGLEEGLIGMGEGETTTLTIPPEKAYGEWSKEQVQEFDTAEIQDRLGGQTPEEGDFLQTQDGQRGNITHIDEDVMRVDFNPQLAGQTLEFEIEVVEVN